MTEHDDHLDQRRLLASAYLDGEVTAEERARAEADPAVMSEVAALRQVRGWLAVDEAPDPSRREAAIAAALAGGEAAVAAPPPPSRTAGRRTRWLAPLAAAAAAVVVIGGGIVALRSGGSDSDDSSAATRAGQAEAQLDVLADGGGATTTERTIAPAAAASDTALDEVTANDQGDDSAAEATEGTEAAAEETTVASGTAPVFLRSEADLLAFAAGVPDATRSMAGFVPRCQLGRIVGPAVYQPPGAAGVDVEVYVIESTGEIVALESTTCDELLRTGP